MPTRSPRAPRNMKSGFCRPSSPPSAAISTMSSCRIRRASALRGRSACCARRKSRCPPASTTICRYDRDGRDASDRVRVARAGVLRLRGAGDDRRAVGRTAQDGLAGRRHARQRHGAGWRLGARCAAGPLSACLGGQSGAAGADGDCRAGGDPAGARRASSQHDLSRARCHRVWSCSPSPAAKSRCR